MASARSVVISSSVLNRPLPRPVGAHTSIGKRFCIDPGLAPWANSSGLFGPQAFHLRRLLPPCLTALGLKAERRSPSGALPSPSASSSVYFPLRLPDHPQPHGNQRLAEGLSDSCTLTPFPPFKLAAQKGKTAPGFLQIFIDAVTGRFVGGVC